MRAPATPTGYEITIEPPPGDPFAEHPPEGGDAFSGRQSEMDVAGATT